MVRRMHRLACSGARDLSSVRERESFMRISDLPAILEGTYESKNQGEGKRLE